MKKLLLLVLLCFCSGFTEGRLIRHIETTAGSAIGRWYNSTGIKTTGSNQLAFEVKGSRDAVLELATDDSDATRQWTIVIGGRANRKDFLRYKYWKRGAQHVQCNRNSLSQSEYRTFWLSWDHNSIRLGKGDTVGENQYCKLTSTDTNMPTDFYLRLGSRKRNTINWKIHLSGQLTQHIPTSGSGSGDWFQSTGIRITGSNWLVFQAKGSRDAIVGLATDDNDNTRRWGIVIGGHGNTKDFMRYKKDRDNGQTCDHQSLNPTEYRTFWLSWDQSSIRLGDGDTVGQNQYCEQSSTDTNTPTDFFLRLGSYGEQNTIDWIIRDQDFTDTSDASCGHRPLADSHRIVGGSTSTPHSWPWQVSLRSSYGNHYCGGSLIGNNYIVTAAHCKHIRVDRSVDVGAHNRTTCVEPCKRVTVTGVWKYRDYRPARKNPWSPPNNDIAIVKFSPPVNFSDAMSPICLPEANYSPDNSDTECYATGWGTLQWNGNSANGLQEVQLPIVPQAECTRLQSTFEEQTMVCAGNVTDGGIDACQGDSGGPLACHTIGENRWKLFGITSWGSGCAEPSLPGVYTKVTNYLQWIENIIKNDDARFEVRMPAHK